MNKSFRLRKEDREPRWHKIDAAGKVLGRLSTEIAEILRGKDKVEYTPHTDSGDYVVVVNCEKVVLTGNKWTDKKYDHYTGYRGGFKSIAARDVLIKDPARIIMHSVKGMLPKNALNRQVIKKLKIYAGEEHPHKAQVA